MKKYFNLFVTLMVTLFATASFAFTPPPAPQNGWYVSDQAGKLSPDQINALNQKIEQVSRSTKNEFGILLLQTMDGANIEDVANATFKAWGIGKRGLDNGCLIVVSLQERKSRIETGKGVEGEVTDLQASDILKQNLNPHLKRGDFAGGFQETLDALNALIESRHNQKVEPAPTTSGGCSLVAPGAGNDSDGIFGGVLLVAFGLSVLVAVLFMRSRRRQTFHDKVEDIDPTYDIPLGTSHLHLGVEDLKPLNWETPHLDNHIKQQREVRELETLEREVKKLVPATPVVPPHLYPTPVVPATPTTHRNLPPRPRPSTKNVVKTAAVGAGVAAAAVLAAEALEAENRRKASKRREQEANDRRRREQDEEDSRRRRRDDDSSSSSSIFDSGSSSDSSFGGGGFGGGDSGGGGSSSDW